MENGKTAKLIGRKLRHCREEAGLTQQNLGKMIGLLGENSQITISNWERGIKRPNLDHIEAYANLFGRPLDWFFADDSATGSTPAATQPKTPGRPPEFRNLDKDSSSDILVSMIHQVVMIVNAMHSKPKTELVKRTLHRLLEDLEAGV